MAAKSTSATSPAQSRSAKPQVLNQGRAGTGSRRTTRRSKPATTLTRARAHTHAHTHTHTQEIGDSSLWHSPSLTRCRVPQSIRVLQQDGLPYHRERARATIDRGRAASSVGKHVVSIQPACVTHLTRRSRSVRIDLDTGGEGGSKQRGVQMKLRIRR